MVLDCPVVNAEQLSSVRVEELAKGRVRQSRRGLAEQWLVALEAARHIMHPDDRPRAFHSVLLRPNETQDQRPSTLKIKTRMFSVVATKCSVRCIAWLGLGVGTCMGPKHLSKQPTRKRAAEPLD